MPNVNTIADAIQLQNQGNPVNLPFASTGRSAFLVGGQPLVASIPNPMNLIESVEKFPNRAAQALPWALCAAGTYLLGGQVAHQIDIVLGSGPGLSNVIASTGKITSGAGPAKDNWSICIEGLWDSASTKVRGTFYGWDGNVQITQSALFDGITAAALANLQFMVVVTCLNTNAINNFVLTEFSLDLV